MQWLSEYLEKRTTAADAVSEIRSGQTVYIHPGCAVPVELVQALVERSRDLEDVQIVHLKTMGGADYTRPEYERSFRTIALFIGDNVRQAVQEGRAEYMPIFLHEIEGLFERGEIRLDYALIQVSPPGMQGGAAFSPGSALSQNSMVKSSPTSTGRGGASSGMTTRSTPSRPAP